MGWVMARCGCEGLTCACDVRAGDNSINVDGNGTADTPYLITAHLPIIVGTTSDTVDVNVTHDNLAPRTYTIEADAHLSLDELDNVHTAGIAQLNQVLTYVGPTGTDYSQAWQPRDAPQAVIDPSQLTLGDCLQGDASPANPFDVLPAPNGGLTCTPQGLALAGLQGWNPGWTTDGSQGLVRGQSSVLAEYALWGAFVYIRWQLVTGANFFGGRGDWHWTVPFPIGGGGGQSIQAKLLTSNGAWYDGFANINSGSHDLYCFFPRSSATTVMDQMRNASEANPPAGTGVPSVPGDLTMGPNQCRLSFQGWYRRSLPTDVANGLDTDPQVMGP